ncbi:MAG TPA: hypothetical protein VGF67_00115 [Ktedonobacteraceae bacterium]|jgi:hypothetical protein
MPVKPLLYLAHRSFAHLLRCPGFAGGLLETVYKSCFLFQDDEGDGTIPVLL